VNRIEALFKELSTTGRKALMPYITAGYPDLATTAALIEQLPKSGASMLELGIPFSDPIADGPVIQASYTQALSKGIRSEEIFEMIADVRKRVQIPIAAMVSYSIVNKLGPANYVKSCVDVGVDGLIIPDLPLEEAQSVRGLIREAGLSGIMLVAPSTPIERQNEIAKLSSGFIYYMSVTGITGERDNLPPELTDNVTRLKEVSGGKPVCVGFGISKPAQAAMVGKVADGVIVGSAIIRRISQAKDKGLGSIVSCVDEYVSSLAQALNGVGR
jgi:tryptophan synthase alpha chain